MAVRLFWSNIRRKIRELYQAILNDKSDIAICDIKSIYENSGAFVVTLGCNPKETGKISYIHTGLAASACNKLFKRHLFLEAPFAIGKVNEDVASEDSRV